MHTAANQATFTLEIPGIEHGLRVLAFNAREAISRPFSVRLELVSENGQLDLQALLSQPAFLRFAGDEQGLHGQISEIARGDKGPRFTRYSMRLTPSLQRLEHRRNQRIFQHKTVQEIIAVVLKEHHILTDQYQFKLGKGHVPREYCTQYQETDLHFVRRLCEEEGIHFHFQHGPERHLLVFGDDPMSMSLLEQPLIYRHGSGMVAEQPVISTFNVRLAMRPGKVSRDNYDFQHSNTEIFSSAQPRYDTPHDPDPGSAPRPVITHRPELEDYAWPAPFVEPEVGERHTRRVLERHRADQRLASGKSNQVSLRSGYLLQLDEHPESALNEDKWLLISVCHEGKQPQVLEEFAPGDDAPGEFTQGYRNTFEAIPQWTPYRSPLRHVKTLITGSQSAIVSGPPGEEIHCDEYGRVKVKFFWDRESSANEHASCWLRVATGWAQNQYGSVMIPRVGMEVVVAYFDADPDRPYVQACLPFDMTRAPLQLPAEKTQTVLKTQSSPGGGGYNELRIEDRKGEEAISLRAERDLNIHALNDQHVQVDNDRSVKVNGLSTHELHGEEHHLTHGPRKTQVMADDSLTVVGNQNISAANFLLSAGHVHLKCASDGVIDAGLSLTLKAGGHWLSISPAGVFSSVPILPGGIPMAGMPALPALPGALLANSTIEQPDQALGLARNQLSLALMNGAATVELCQKPSGKSPMECPLAHCLCAEKSLRSNRA